MSGQGLAFPQLPIDYNAAYEMGDDAVGDDTTKGPWTPEEDNILRGLVIHHGPKNWTKIAECIPGRTGKSCRLRWLNQLSPDVKSGPFTFDEDAVILWAHLQYGNKWALIAKHLPGRTDNHIKNRWNCTLKKRYSRMLDQLRTDPTAAVLTVADVAGMMGQRNPGEGRGGPGGGPSLAGWPLGPGPGPMGLGLGQGPGAGPLGPTAQLLAGGGAGPQGPFGAGQPLGAGPMGQLPLGLRDIGGGLGAGGLGPGGMGAAGLGGLGLSLGFGLGGPAGGPGVGGLPQGLQQPLMMLMQPPAGPSPRSRALAAAGLGPGGAPAGAASDQERLARLGPGLGGGAFALYNGPGGDGGGGRGNNEDTRQEGPRGTKRTWEASGNSSEDPGPDEGEDTAAMALEQLAHQRSRGSPRYGGSRGGGGRRSGDTGGDYGRDGSDSGRNGSDAAAGGAANGQGKGARSGGREAGEDEAVGRGRQERRASAPSRAGDGPDGGRRQSNDSSGSDASDDGRRGDGRRQPAGVSGLPNGLAAQIQAALASWPQQPNGRNETGPNLQGLLGGTPLPAAAAAALNTELPPAKLPPLTSHQLQQPQQSVSGSRGPAAGSAGSDMAGDAGSEPAGAAAPPPGGSGLGPGNAGGLAAGGGGGGGGAYGALLVSLPEALMQLSSTLRVVLSAQNLAAAQALVSKLEELAYTLLMQRAAYNFANASEVDGAKEQRQERPPPPQLPQQQQEQQQQQQPAAAAGPGGLVGGLMGGGGGVDPQALAQLLLLGGIS
ncbi:hypothetical protein Agub_g3122 [Astrephomene gubernaculifera]|uniref:Uncharacterized protein n=1 Tax=Astrephomene gubernaculifera TaxID=47775 RepID=A0AAD3HI65_9CHLO|nr:hypothetical protein Agub_g3122 [Astrephomene gubernaculifera]